MNYSMFKSCSTTILFKLFNNSPEIGVKADPMMLFELFQLTVPSQHIPEKLLRLTRRNFQCFVSCSDFHLGCSNQVVQAALVRLIKQFEKIVLKLLFWSSSSCFIETVQTVQADSLSGKSYPGCSRVPVQTFQLFCPNHSRKTPSPVSDEPIKLFRRRWSYCLRWFTQKKKQF